MKILLISDLYPLEADLTIPSVLEDFSLSMKNLGNYIEIIRPNFLINTLIRKHKIIKSGTYEKNNIKIHNRNFFFPFLFENINFLKEKFDIIISHLPSGHIYADLINKQLKLPRISIVHQSDYTVLNDFKYAFYFKNKLKKALKNSNLIGARNNFLSEKLNADFILPSFIKKNFIVKEKKLNDINKLKIITLSKLIKRKNIDLVIKALFEVDFDFEYNIYGEGKERKNLENLIKKFHLDEKIKIHPHINHNEIYKKLDEHDIFILPSVNESFGIAYLEAMARGLITIATKKTGIDGIIKTNKNGFLINPKKEEIKDTLHWINISNKEELIKNTLINIQNYEEEKIMTKYFNNIKKIL